MINKNKLNELIKKYQIGERLYESPKGSLEDVYWFFFLTMFRTYLNQIGLWFTLENNLIKKWLKNYEEHIYLKYSKGYNTFSNPEENEYYSLLKKLEREGHIKIPKLIRKYFDKKSEISIISCSFNCKIGLEDLEEYIKIADIFFINTQYKNQEEALISKNIFTIASYERKDGIARISGNGSVLTLPKAWIGSRVIAFRI